MIPLKIVIDVRMLNHSGIGTYLQNLLPYFQETRHKIYLLGKGLDIDVKAPIYSLREQWEIPLKVPECDVYWSPHINVPLLPIRAKTRIVTIQDLYHLVHIKTFSFHKRLYIKKIVAHAVSTASKVICISEFTKKEILRYFPETEKKLEVIYLGAGQQFINKSVKVPGIVFPYFLFVGNCKPHKNIQLLLEAFQKFLNFSKQSIHLVIAGKKEGFIHGMKFPALPQSIQNKIHFVGTVSKEQLAWLYQHAYSLVFPSLYEGWGLPPFEAMRFGCPVIASNAASIPEACQDAVSYFDPFNTQDLCEKMVELPDQKEKLIQAGYKRISQLSWEKSAKKHLQVFEEIASSLIHG